MLPEEGWEGDVGRSRVVKSPQKRQTRSEETTQVEVF